MDIYITTRMYWIVEDTLKVPGVSFCVTLDNGEMEVAAATVFLLIGLIHYLHVKFVSFLLVLSARMNALNFSSFKCKQICSNN